MAIVGHATVRVNVITSDLSRNIANAVRSGFNAAGSDFDREGRRAGERTGSAAAEGVQRSTPEMRRAAGDIGQSFSDALDRSLRRNLANTVIPNFGTSLRNGLRRNFRGIDTSVVKSFDFKKFTKAGQDLGKELHRGFNLGIGAARMGPAVRSALALATPSLLSGAGSLGAAMGAQIISSLAASGPAIGGALGVLTAGLATAALNVGLLAAAFNAGNEELDAAKEGWKELGKEFGKPIAQGMAQGFGEAAGLLREALPQINELLQQTGMAFGAVTRRIAETITRADNISRIGQILSTNKDFIDNFREGIGGLTTSFLILFNAAKPFIDFIGESIKKFGEWAESTLAAKEANGELAAFMQKLLDGFKNGMSTITDFAVGIKNIFKAAAGGAGNIGEIAEKFRAWTENPENMERMERFFEKMHTLASALIGLFGGLAAAAGRALEKMDPGPILKVFEIITDKIAPALGDLWNQVQSGAGENLVKIFDNLGTMLQKIVDSGTFETIARFISDVLVKVSEFLASDFGSTIAAWLIPLGLFGGIFTSLIGPISTIITLLSGPFAAVIGIIAAVAGFFVLVYQKSEAFREAVGKLAELVGTKFTEIWDNLWPKIQVVWEKIQLLAEAIGNRLGPIIEALLPVFSTVFDTIGVILDFIVTHFGLFIQLITNIINGDWSAAWDTFLAILSNIWDLIIALWDTAGQFILQKLEEFRLWVGQKFIDLGNWIISIVTGFLAWIGGLWDQLFLWVMTKLGEFIAWVLQAWNNIKAGAEQVWNNIYNFFVMIWNNIIAAVQNLIETWKNWLAQRWADIKAAAEEVWNNIKGAAETIWNNIVAAIKQIVDNVVSDLAQKWEDIKAGAETVWNNIVGAAETAWNSVYDAIVQPIIDAYNTLTGWIADIKEIVQGVWDFVTGKVADINTSIAAASQAQADFNAAHPGGDAGIFAPASAEGGIFRPTPGGQLRTVAEAGQAERLEPLDKSGLSQRDHAMIEKLAGSVGGGATIIVKIGETELTEIVDTRVVRANERTGRSLRNGVRI